MNTDEVPSYRIKWVEFVLAEHEMFNGQCSVLMPSKCVSPRSFLLPGHILP